MTRPKRRTKTEFLKTSIAVLRIMKYRAHTKVLRWGLHKGPADYEVQGSHKGRATST